MGRPSGGVGAMDGGCVVGALTEEQIRVWTATSCAEQGLPVAITDPVVVDRVAVLLTGRARRNGRARPPAGDDRSQAPHGLDPVDVEAATVCGCGVDGGVVEDGGDDRGLAGEVEVLPRSA